MYLLFNLRYKTQTMTDVYENSIDTEITNSEASSAGSNNATSQQTIEIYKQALTFNVIAKYDTAITQLLHISSYCVIYQYDEESEDWVKSSYMGPITIYSRRSYWDKFDINADIKETEKINVNKIINSKNGEYYKFGLMVLNRSQPENFSLGLLGDRYLNNDEIINERNLLIEKSDELIIIRDFEGNAFGFWIFDEKDRDYLYQLLMYCIDKLE